MGRYLDILRRESPSYELNELNERTHSQGCADPASNNQRNDLIRQIRLFRAFQRLERRCPDHIDVAGWQQAVEDSRRFLTSWSVQAEALGWTAADLFGLAPVPEKVTVTYRRLSRVELTGLIWMLHGRPVLALTESSAAIQTAQSKSILTFRRQQPSAGTVLR